ncbi:MAG: hypothetical protein H6825_01865 [Planctomycetes bacterium]|nr:hypothetical protein [Planctomycetota bacterium]
MLVGASVAQGPSQNPLPSGLTVRAWAHSCADVLHVPTSDPGDSIEGRITFRNGDADPQVEIEWIFKTSAGGKGRKTTTHDVAFLPTSVCVRAGRSDRIYVVGWSPRSSKVIVEEWTLKNIAIAETLTPGGAIIATMAGPTIDREIVAASDSLPLTACAACNPFTDELYLLDLATPRAIHTLDLQTGALQAAPLLTELQQPDLADHRGLHAGRTDQGFVIFSRWESPWVASSLVPLPQQVIVLLDADLDGVFETVQSQPVEQFNAANLGHWVSEYTGP